MVDALILTGVTTYLCAGGPLPRCSHVEHEEAVFRCFEVRAFHHNTRCRCIQSCFDASCFLRPQAMHRALPRLYSASVCPARSGSAFPSRRVLLKSRVGGIEVLPSETGIG